MRAQSLFLIAYLSLLTFCYAEETGRVPFTGHTIKVDRNISDWIGVAPDEENSATASNGEYIWKDAVGDNTGNGRYTYPLDRLFKGGADLQEFRITYDKNNLYFLIKTDKPADWWTGFKIIGIHKERIFEGTQILAQGDKDNLDFDSGTFANLKVSPALACQYIIAISSTYKGRIWDDKGRLIARREEGPDDTRGFEIGDPSWDVLEVAIPLKLLGVTEGASLSGETWKFIVATGQQDNDIARKVEAKQSRYYGGGGAENGDNPNIYDLAGADKTAQEKELGSYNPSARAGDPSGFAVLEKSFLTVTFGGII